MPEVTSGDAPGGHDGNRDAGRSVLLGRRHRLVGTCSFNRCWTPISPVGPADLQVAHPKITSSPNKPPG
jgi:hypothetical protein